MKNFSVVLWEYSLVFLEYSFHTTDLDSLWQELKSFDLAVLNCLFELNRADECLHALYLTIRDLVNI